ncbi:hypothetical protein [Paraburkholderia sp. J76]|uniref:hypothetical protein n=1 Tax=Paraburkholderia sp. J76 TaxID=2805439 RepID=UPI002ABE5F73|nr:hypothetical protein [Paraburkholderia sp. J76]
MFKKTVDSWDLFDTLVGRFHISAESVFDLMAPKTGMPGFKAARMQAQRDLDAIGKPYDLREVYRQFCRTTGADARSTAPALFALEVATELEQLIPVRAQISQVARGDLIVSDMYLPEDIIVDILRRVCGLAQNGYPPVVGNWGKHTGTVWPVIQQHYMIRCHHGDNPVADGVIPQRFRIRTRHVTDTGVTPWENALLQANMREMALALREVRLRCMPAQGGQFEYVVVGEFLGMLLLYALFLRIHAEERDIRHYLFAAREGVHLSAVFRALMPGFDSEVIDFNRRMLGSGRADGWFRSRLTPHSAAVDIVSSGRSVGQFCARTGVTVPLVTLFSVGTATLAPEEIEARERTGFLAVLGPDAPDDRFHAIEALTDPGYPSVHDIAIDAGSRAVVRAMTPDDLTPRERECAEFVGNAVTELVEVIHRRSLRFDGVDKTQITTLLRQASQALLKLQHHIESPSYLAKNIFPQNNDEARQAADV